MPTEPPPVPAWRVHGVLLLVQLAFGAHYPAVKLLLEEVPAAAWSWVRVATAALLLLAVTRLAGRRFAIARADCLRLALYALFGVVLNQLCYAEGMARTSAAHASILMTTIPLATLSLAVLLGREAADPWKIVAVGAGLAGVVLVIGSAGDGRSAATLVGDLLILVNALSYSLFLVLSKRLMSRIDSLPATALLLAFGAVGMLPLSLRSLAALEPAAISARGWALAAFIVLVPTAGAYLLTTWALARVDSSVVALFIYLQPLVATGIAVVLLGERVPPRVALGALVVFVAVYLALRPPGRRPPTAVAEQGTVRAEG